MILFTNKALITNTARQLSAVLRCQFETLFEKPIEIEFSCTESRRRACELASILTMTYKRESKQFYDNSIKH